MATPPDDRLTLAQAYQCATRVVTIAIAMVVPGLVGYWLDSRWGTRALATMLGFALGMTYGIMQSARMSPPQPEEVPDSTSREACSSRDDDAPNP